MDSAEHLGDFQNGVNTGDDYTYDANDNMASDANKKITAIIYNSLNLPEVIRVGGKGSIYYSYDATGNKLRKRTVDSTSLPAKTVITTYINSGVYLNDTLQLFGTTEGRVRPVGTIFVNDYFLKDHLGNTRMVITDDYNVASPILEASSYYPFGLQQKGIGLIASSPIHNFKNTFQKQEINEDLGVDIYEFKYRIDDPQIGRFWQIDPLADKYVYNSTYAFSENKVTSHVELEGLESVLFRYILFPTIFSPPTKQEAKANGRAINGLVRDLKKVSIESMVALSVSTLKSYYKLKSLFGSTGSPTVLKADANEGDAPKHGSTNHNDALDNRVKELETTDGITNIRKNQQQVDKNGNKVGNNRPDIQYDKEDGHHNEEYDHKKSNSDKHANTIKRNDPNAHVHTTILKKAKE